MLTPPIYIPHSVSISFFFFASGFFSTLKITLSPLLLLIHLLMNQKYSQPFILYIFYFSLIMSSNSFSLSLCFLICFFFLKPSLNGPYSLNVCGVFLPIFACLYFIKIEAHFFHWLQCIESGNCAHAASLNLLLLGLHSIGWRPSKGENLNVERSSS